MFVIKLMLVMALCPIHDLSDKTCEIHCIYLSEFEKRIIQYKSLNLSEDTISIELAIDMVRICNTIAYSKTLNANELYYNFVKYFYTECIDIVAKKIEAIPSRGLSYYSKKYNLYIGGSIHMNSKYCIIDL